MLQKIIAICLISLLWFASCTTDSKNEYEKTDEGLEYKYIVESKSGKQPKNGEKLLLHIKYFNSKDSLMFDSRDISPRFIMDFAQPKQKGAMVEDAYALMQEGDSMSFKIDAHTFFSAADKNSPMLKKIAKGEKLRFEIKLEKIFDESAFKEESKNAIKEMCEEERYLLEAYIEKNYPGLKPTSRGLYYIEIMAGTGKKVTPTSSIAIHYKASYINGEPIYSTYKKVDPLLFQVNDSLVWPCLAEAALYMKKGGKSICISPSYLAAGEYGDAKIPPCKSIIFEMEVVSVK